MKMMSKQVNYPRRVETKMKAKKCWWVYDDTHDYWEGTCGILFCLNDGSPEENKMRYCPNCGRKLTTDTPKKGRGGDAQTS